MEYISQDMKKLHTLMQKINDGAIRLPSFQRRYVWKHDDIVSLLDSIQHRFPAGSLLFYETGGSIIRNEKFKYSEANVEAEHLVMDGQQRLTSCYRVFYNHFSNTYFINLWDLYQLHKTKKNPVEPVDFESVIVTKRNNKKHLSAAFDNDMLPFPYMKDRDVMRNFLKTYRDRLREDPDRKDYLDFVESNLETYLDPFFEYQFPIIVLPKNLSLPSVCKIFQTVNTTGVKLDSFDICVAKFSMDDVYLKDMIAATADSSPINLVTNNDKNKLMTLQIIALSKGKDHRKNKLVDLDSTLVTDNWQDMLRALEDTLRILDNNGVGTTKSLSLVSYDVMIPVIAATLISVGYSKKKADEKGRIENIIKQYYYYASFNERYKDGAATKMETDYKALIAWIKDGILPKHDGAKTGQIFFKGGLKWTEEEIVGIKKGTTSAIGKAVLSAINKRNLIDFYNQDIVGLGEKKTDSELHHIFPKAYYEKKISDKYLIDSIFNLTFLSKSTNNNIKDHSTVDYYNNIVGQMKTEDEFKKCLNGHVISDKGIDAFLNQDYEAFIEARIEYFKEILSKNMGLEIRPTSVEENDDAIEEFEE